MKQRGGGGGGRDFTRSPKLFDGKFLANKLLQVINLGREAICRMVCFNTLQMFQTLSASLLLFSLSLILFSISISNTAVSAGPPCLLKTL